MKVIIHRRGAPTSTPAFLCYYVYDLNVFREWAKNLCTTVFRSSAGMQCWPDGFWGSLCKIRGISAANGLLLMRYWESLFYVILPFYWCRDNNTIIGGYQVPDNRQIAAGCVKQQQCVVTEEGSVAKYIRLSITT